MNRIYFPSNSLDDWKAALASPQKQWRKDYSAMAVAESWQNADGFPPSIFKALRDAPEPLNQLTPLLILPEHRVSLDNGQAPSHNDVWVLAAHPDGLVSIAVEGKVSETFDAPLGEWLKDASQGKKERLAFLTEILGLSAPLPDSIRYQLLHRAASALIEAKRFHATTALLLIQSFSGTDEGLDDFEEFCNLFGASVSVGGTTLLGTPDGIPLYALWTSNP